METIGWAALQIIPAMRGVEGQMAGQLAGPMKVAGQRAGKDAGDAIAAGLASAKASVDKATTDLAKSQDKVKDATGRVRVAEAALLELREKNITSGARFTRATEALEAAKRKEAAASRDAEQATSKLADAEKRATDAADGGGGKVSRFAGAFDGFGDRVKNGGVELKDFAVAAAGIGGAVAIGMQALDNMDVESRLAAQLGATGDLAAKYGDDAGKLWKQGIAGSMDEAADAVGVVATSFVTAGFEGEKAVDEIAASALTFSNVFGTDMTEAVNTASLLVTNGLAKDSTEAFDLMTSSFQSVPAAMRDELPEILHEYGTNFRGLGFDGKEAFNVLVAAADKGKFALDKTGDALKEFTILGSDMSKSSTEAYATIGLDAEEMSRKVAAGGDGAQAALQMTARGLLAIQDPAERANTAIALFGTPLEDLSVDQIPAFLETLTGAEDRMGGFAGSSQQMSDTINSGPNHALTVLTNTIQGTITDGIGMAAQFLIEHADLWGQIGAVVGGLASAVLPAIWSALQTGIGILGGVADAIASVVNWFREHEVVAGIVASVITVGLLPALTSMTVGFVTSAASAVASGATLTAVWISTQASAVASAAAQVVAQYRTVAGWVAAGAAAVANGAIMVGQWIAAGATATAQAAIAAGAWVASSARTVGALALQGAAFIASRAVLVAGTVATTAATAAQWLFNAALSANPIGLIIAAVAALVAGLVWFFTQTELGQQIVTAAWNAIKAGWDAMWSGVSAGIDAFVAALGWISDKAGEVKDWVVGKWDELVGFVTGLPGRISSAASGMWDGIKDAFRGAINWIISKWNNFQLVIGGQKISIAGLDIDVPTVTLNTPDIPMLATGGPITGGTPGKDSVLAMLMPGEHVLDTGDVAALGGQRGVYAMRAGLDAGLVPRFAEGGAVVSPDQLVNFAKGVEGKPYVWGGVNWGDCSGAVSAVANFATGRSPFGSRFATGTEGAELADRGFKSGLGPAGSLNVGWFNGGPYGGHTAATLPNGVNFEMGGGRGDGQYGGPASGANDPQFTDHAYLPMINAAALQPSVTEYATPPMTWGDDPMSSAAPSTGATPGSPATPATPQQSFSARERWKQMGSDIGGIWADSFVEIFGLGDAFALADRYAIKSDQSSAAMATQTAPAAPADPRNGVEGDPNIHPLIRQAQDFLGSVGLFDTGGTWEPGTFGFNGLNEPEHVLKDAHWRTAEANIDKVDELVGAGVGGGPRVVVNNYNNQTIADQASWQRDQAERQSIAILRYGGGNG
ncbi:phage-related minor tail protein [Rhodococcus sp. OK611]|uniref:phage tail tape measure protein n=1 Tax=unclassified Rhodococcus (in: high G+C Gram-positive bacteria) TaxID=192944 RepID=UPI000BD74708|nr:MULTISPECIES: phage tail tape measure protein [unclassified Rhodococcus (in: high G+C Gram-positive bacteria)]PTR42026.1 phage-related minor tail protein [Rhodococcus sp. OK611]SNX91527.1 Phage-related minor tail protein [Rhodococcus sp. OK270]